MFDENLFPKQIFILLPLNLRKLNIMRLYVHLFALFRIKLF